MLKLLHNNVFDVVADALLLTIDGQARGLRGNVAHAFQRRWPDAYEDFESRLRYEVIRRGLRSALDVAARAGLQSRAIPDTALTHPNR